MISRFRVRICAAIVTSSSAKIITICQNNYHVANSLPGEDETANEENSGEFRGLRTRDLFPNAAREHVQLVCGQIVDYKSFRWAIDGVPLCRGHPRRQEPLRC